MPELSVVVLCYRSGAGAIDFTNRLFRNFNRYDIGNFEIVLVANYLEGTDDKTPLVVQEIASKHDNIKFSARPKEGMMGWDMKCGLTMATGRYIAVIDGDGQMPIIDLVRVFNEIREKKVDLVKTYREVRGDGPWRKLISYVFNACFNIIFPGIHSRDINSKPKIMSREFLNKLDLKSDDWFIDAEIMIHLRRINGRFRELPTEFLGLRGKRKSFVRLPAIWEFAVNLAKARMEEFRK